MTRRRTGPGRISLRPAGDRVNAVLYNFDIDWHELKPEHQAFLDREVVPIIRAGGSLSVEGRASRTGTPTRNDTLSAQRMQETLDYIRRRAGREFRFAQFHSVGERAAERAGQADGTEDAYYRAVIISAWSRPDPPPPPPPPPPPEEPSTPPQATRFRMRMVSGTEFSGWPSRHDFIFEIWDGLPGPAQLHRATYRYQGTSYVPQDEKMVTRFGPGPWTDFQAFRAMTVRDFAGRASLVIMGACGKPCGPRGLNPTASAPIRMYPTQVAPRRIDVTLRPGRHSCATLSYFVSTNGRMVLRSTP